MSTITGADKMVRKVEQGLYGYYEDYYKIGSPMGVRFTKKAKFTSPNHLITIALLQETAKLHQVSINLDQAEIDRTQGWMIVEITGTGNEIDKALQWMVDQDVQIQIMFSNI